MDHAASVPMLFEDKDHAEPSIFRPENLLREARRQRGMSEVGVPETCILDPDGDLQDGLRAMGRSTASPGWACYHTRLDEFELEGARVGIVGRAVGAPFAVLVAEQLFASGCRFLISISSAGQIETGRLNSRFLLIDRALRDEGTSHHYLPPSRWASVDPKLADAALAERGASFDRGSAWTTDAPYRETASAIARARACGAVVVEMEAAALYAFARARGRTVLCFAHVTNQMAQTLGDFEKGEADGAREALAVISAAMRAWRAQG